MMDCRTSVYKPLDPLRKEIRILSIADTPANAHEAIQFHLETISLTEDRCLPYEAISWCWGDASLTKNVEINGISVEIPTTAYEALVAVGFRHGHGRIWIDAICMNMIDHTERSQQVSIMHEIYSKCQRVLIWLGRISESEKVVIESVDLLAEEARHAVVDTEELANYPFRFDATFPEGCNEDAIEVLYSCAWFTRVWAFQEAVLAKDAICVVGDTSTSLANITIAATWMTRGGYGPKGRTDKSFKFDRGVTQAKNIWSFRETGGNKRHPFNWLLHASMSLEATDGRDKVFGIRGLMRESFRFWKDNDTRLEPDYTKSLKDVYVDATRASIDASGQLLMCRLASLQAVAHGPTYRDSEDDRAWPSWVPHFDRFKSEDQGAPNLIPRVTGVGAANGLKLKLTLQNVHQDELCVEGVLVDEVNFVSPAIWDYQNRSNAHLAETLWRIWNLLGAGVDATFKHFASTLICRDNDELASEQDQDLSNAIEAFESICERRYHDALKDGDTTSTHQKAISEDADAFLKHNWRRSINRVVFRTAYGRLGLGPPTLRNGDHVAIVFGELVPVVLRFDSTDNQIRERCSIVGDAYIHSLMEGEFIQLLNRHELFEESRRWFCIC